MRTVYASFSHPLVSTLKVPPTASLPTIRIERPHRPIRAFRIAIRHQAFRNPERATILAETGLLVEASAAAGYAEVPTAGRDVRAGVD